MGRGGRKCILENGRTQAVASLRNFFMCVLSPLLRFVLLLLFFFSLNYFFLGFV